jgi:hypothetical protein
LTGSTQHGSVIGNTHQFTGSVLMTGSLSVTTTGTELQVNASGVNIGNALTDNHIISGSVRINPNGLFVSSSGFVGIGTTSPSQLLEVVGGEIKAGRVDSSNEGGQVSFGRATDNATAWYIDAYGNVASPQLRFVDVTGAAVRMTMTGSNVGIGTSAPRANFDVSDGTVNTSGEGIYQGLFTGPSRPSTSDLTAILTIQSNDAMAINKGGSIAFGGRAVASNSAGANWAGIGGLKENGTGSDYSGYLQFWTRGGSSSEKMRITSGGQVGVATTTIASAFNMQVGNNSGVIATTILRLQDSYLSGTTGYYGAQITAVDNGVDGHNLLFQTRANATSVFSTRMTITTTGNIGAPSGTNIYNASDIRLKQNVSTTTYGLDAISLLNPVKFNWVDGFEPTEDGKDMLGFVAQEVLEVIPEAVESFGGDINLNGELIDNPLRVNEKFIIPVLVKAIQEQQAKITALEEILQRNNIQ